MPVIEPKSKEEYDKALAEAKGPVLVEFTQNGCGHCDPAALNKLAADCGDKAATVMQLEISQPESFGAEVADAFGVDGTPTALLAMTPQDWNEQGLKAGRVQEVDPESSAIRRKLKCAVPARTK